MNARDVLIYLAVKLHGEWDEIYKFLDTKQQIDFKEVENVNKSLKCNAVTFLDKTYPEQLKQIYKPPYVLFYEGDLSLLEESYKRNVAVVGARDPSEYGTKYCNSIVKDISKDYVIVSGLAKGIDSIAHNACIKSGGRTIAVLGCGLDYYYPSENKSLQNNIKAHHLLLSEYPLGTPPKPNNFVIRNRIVIGLSKGVIVFDVREMSGTISSVNLACHLSRDLMSIPYPIGTEFINNKIINEGANVVENGNDVRQVMTVY